MLLFRQEANMKFKFVEDIAQDMSIWQRSMEAKSYGYDWSVGLPKDISKEQVLDGEYLKKYLEETFYKTGRVGAFIKFVEEKIKPEEIEGDLGALMGRKFLKETVTVSIVTFPRGPYDVRTYKIYLILNEEGTLRPVSSIYHELMHFLFHEHFWEECQKAGLTEPQIHDLKESLTVLLNPILEKRGLPLEKGYPNHLELRAKLKELWEEKEWKFEDFLKEVLKRNMVIEGRINP